MKLSQESKFHQIDFKLICRKPIFIVRAFVRYLQNRFTKGHYLASISFATTYNCNFNCSHCYAKEFRRTDKKPLTLEEKKNVIKECIDNGAVAFDFVGGEISQSPELEELIKACKPYMTYISITTNGYDLDREKLQKYYNWGVDKLCVSIDSWYEDEHDKFRNKKGSYRHCFNAIKTALKVGLKPVISMIVVRDTTKTEGFKKMVEYAISNDIQLIFSVAIPFGQYKNNFSILVGKEDLEEMRRLHKLHPILTRDNYESMGKKGCPAFKQWFQITEYGDVMPCAFTHIAFGNVRNESIKSIRNRALSLDYFKEYATTCLASENKEFIDNYLSKNYNTKYYPVHAEDIFKEIAEFPTENKMKRNIKKNFVECSLCGSVDYKIVADGQEHEFDNTTDDIFHVVKCKKCGLIYLNPVPDISELSTIYPTNYYCYNDTVPDIGAKQTILGRFKKMLVNKIGFPKTIRHILNNYKTTSRIRVLDIGCGNGWALNVFKQCNGASIETYGIDISEKAVLSTSKKGHTVYRGVFDTTELPANYFDIVYSSNVIEHVVNPAKFISKVSAILKDDGYFLCETPNIDSIEARFLGNIGFWGGYHVPRHWTFFTPQHIKKMADNYGLKVQDIDYLPIPIFWIWTFHSIIFKVFNSKKMADIFFPLFENNVNYIYSLLLKVNFTIWDYIIKVFTRRTSMMSVVFVKKK